MIAEACGVSKALMYHYYNSKEDVLFDILADHLKHLLVVVEVAAGSTDNAKERLFAISSALLEAYRGADAEHKVKISSLKLLCRPSNRKCSRNGALTCRDRLRGDRRRDSPGRGNDQDALTPLTMSLFAMLNWHFLWFREGKGLTREAYAHYGHEPCCSGRRRCDIGPRTADQTIPETRVLHDNGKMALGPGLKRRARHWLPTVPRSLPRHPRAPR